MLIQADARAIPLCDASVDCVVTSPPYFGLRDYGHTGQIGLEPTGAAYIETLVMVFRELRRVMKPQAVAWLNLGDSYNAYNGGAGPGSLLSKTQTEQRPRLETGFGLQDKALKPKDLMMIPARVALALQADGWYLRSDIIWHKPNPMPESVTDRPTKAHEYLFLLTKNERYYYNADAIAEPIAESQVGRVRDDVFGGSSWVERGQHSQGGRYAVIESRASGLDWKPQTEIGLEIADTGRMDARSVRGGVYLMESGRDETNQKRESRNKRSVWTVNTMPYAGAHFATMPEKLVEPCILAGCPMGGLVLDPFVGSGTVVAVAQRLGRLGVGVDLSYQDLSKERTAQRGLRF